MIKLTDEQVLGIMKECVLLTPKKKIASMYKVSTGLVRKIYNGKSHSKLTNKYPFSFFKTMKNPKDKGSIDDTLFHFFSCRNNLEACDCARKNKFFILTPEMLHSHLDINEYICPECGLKSLSPSICEACGVLRSLTNKQA